MCLAVPGLIIDLLQQESPLLLGLVEFGGVRKKISLACVPDAKVGDYVLAHAGIAISQIDAAEAARVWELVKEIAEHEQIDMIDDSESQESRR